ncbi:MAG: methionyl-tRNA formyltransferase [bacterium]|nr:methionyl-tRNA formyltransferase [bacterium]
MATPRKTCLFLGTSDFSLPSLEMLAGGGVCELLGVVTQSDKPAGRGHRETAPPVARWAREHGLRVWQPETKGALTEIIRELAPDVVVVVAYGRLIASDALDIPPHGYVNLHPSLLPRWRGPSPIVAAIAAGDRETGVTVMRIDAQMDHGPILAQEATPLPADATRSQMEERLAKQGAKLLLSSLTAYLNGTLTPVPQDDARATTCPLLSREDGHINWSESATVIERKVRAYEGWPGTWVTEPSDKRLKVLATHVATSASPGTLSVICGDGQVLILDRVQPEGKPPMRGDDFLRGRGGAVALA